VPFDVHLMIEEPLQTLDQYLDAGAARVAVHVEADRISTGSPDRPLAGASPGVAINPGTSLAALEEALDFCDFVLVMTVNPGWGGQSFLPHSTGRVRRLATRSGRRGSPAGSRSTGASACERRRARIRRSPAPRGGIFGVRKGGHSRGGGGAASRRSAGGRVIVIFGG